MSTCAQPPAGVERLSQKQVSQSCKDRHPERSRRMTTAQQQLSHGSTPLTMTFITLGAALAALLGKPLDICRAQAFSTVPQGTL